MRMPEKISIASDAPNTTRSTSPQPRTIWIVSRVYAMKTPTKA